MHCLPGYMVGYESMDDLLGDDRDSWLIDDFELGSDTAITALDWAGGCPADLQPQYFIITFYETLPDCEGPDDESLIISEQIVYDYTFAPAEWEYDYHADIEPVVLPAGVYWVGIRGALEHIGPFDVWFWILAVVEAAWNCDAMMRSPILGADIFTPLTDWNPDYIALGFTLYGDAVVATESATWSGVKVLYR